MPKILIFSKKPADGEDLAGILAGSGYETAWTDNGPETIIQALSGSIDAVVIFLQQKGHRELEYVPCLNSIDQSLPVVVISRHDTLKLQRAVRKYKVFYYLPLPLEPDEIRAVMKDAVASSGRKR